MYYVKEMPEEERPRERLMKYGASSLSNSELLAIILRTGYKDTSVIELAKTIIAHFEQINRLNDATFSELTKIKGLGPVKAIELMALVELGKRINQPLENTVSFDTPKKIYEYLKGELQNLNQENLVALFLNIKGEIITKKLISIGTLNTTMFHPRDILKWALKYSAYAIVIAHNHPSGDPIPSENDIEMTKILVNAASLVDMVIIDHIIIGKNRYFSFLENNFIRRHK